MRLDVKSIGDFKFHLLGLVCSCLSLSLGPVSLPSLEPSFCCVRRLCQSAGVVVWYSSGLCPGAFYSACGQYLLDSCAPDNTLTGMEMERWLVTVLTGLASGRMPAGAQVKLEQQDWQPPCYFIRAFSGSSAHFPGTVLHGSSEAGGSPSLLCKGGSVVVER